MNVFVFGAGASLHAGYPLASRLGAALHEWVCKTKPANHDFRLDLDQIGNLYSGLENIEQVLTDLEESLPGSLAAQIQRPLRARLLASLRYAIREYFNDLQGAPSCPYALFARQSVRAGDVIITFNYDIACERELKRAGLWEISDGYSFSIGLKEIESSKLKVLKLHGSINWWGIIFGGNTRGASVSTDHGSLGRRPTIFFRSDFESLGYPDQLCDPECLGIVQSAGIPAIIMPTYKKRFFEQTSLGREWEPFWRSLWSRAGNALAVAEHITIIGYSMADADREARMLLLEKSNRNAKIMIYSGGSSTRIQGEFCSRGFRSVGTVGKGHFEDFLKYRRTQALSSPTRESAP
jgi:hypothetical protein